MKTHLLPGSILKYCYCLLSCSYGYQDHFKRAEYNKSGTVHRIPMPVCITLYGQNLGKPIFTPYIKAEQGDAIR